MVWVQTKKRPLWRRKQLYKEKTEQEAGVEFIHVFGDPLQACMEFDIPFLAFLLKERRQFCQPVQILSAQVPRVLDYGRLEEKHKLDSWAIYSKIRRCQNSSKSLLTESEKTKKKVAEI